MPKSRVTTPKRNSEHPRKSKKAWLVIALIVGVLVVGALLARLSPVVVIIAILAVAGLGIAAVVGRPIRWLGVRSRRSGFVALGAAAMLMVGSAASGANISSAETAPAAFTVRPAQEDVESTAPKHAPEPVPTTFETVIEESAVAFERTTADDPNLDQGTTVVTTAGADGIKTTTYRATVVDGAEVSRELISENVTQAPVNEVTSIGTRAPAPPPVAAQPAPLVQQGNDSCDSNYTGACVPIASDVDCAGGGGNGPAYVEGPVQIIGNDIYKLDRDGDGVACD